MPAQHQAMFDPIPPDLDLTALVNKTNNFDWVERIKLEDVKRMGWVEFEKLVAIQVIHGGRPLIVEGWGTDLPPWVYSADWLKTNMGKKVEAVGDTTNETNHEMTIGHYLDNMGKLTKAMTPAKYRDPKRQRLYLKDIDCPKQWREQLSTKVPKFLFYMNENVSEIGEPGSTTYKNGVGQVLQTQGIAPAGDLMSNLPPEMRAENLQLYIGHEGTYTPAHKEMCGTSSQNIMVETSSTLKDGEKDGSSIWFMTESQDREIVSEYFLSMLGHDIEIEKHFAQVVAWKKAPFPVYVAEQKVGDLVLVPPLAPHQVWNRGNRTIKVAWNRTTVETLEFALAESLPRARMVCRDEQYRVKATVYYSLVKYYARLREADKQDEQHEFTNENYEKVWDSFRVQLLKEDFCRLAKLFSDIMVEEMFSLELPKEKDVEYLPFEGNVTCSYCRCNIFNRFLTCKSCVEELVNGDEDTYDVCMDCYVMGRSCACISGLKWVEQWRWAELTKKYDEYHDLVRFITPDADRWILPLAEECIKRGKKTTAEVCQEQLVRRPWNDIQNPDPTILSDIEKGSEDEDFKKRMGTKRRRPKAAEKLSTKPCHICKKPDKPWKLAECTTCDAAYCYGSLWRAFDLKPENIMKDPNWRCPECLDICSCAACQRKHPHRTIYEPKGTLLGHDTKAVADPRSVESLVDFSRTNMAWLKDNDTNPKKTKRMQKLIEEAKAQKIAYYRYAAVEWGMDPNNSGPDMLKGYPKERPESNGNTPAPVARGYGGSQAANDSGLDMEHRQTMSPSFDHTAPVAPMGSMGPPPAPAYNNAGYPSNIYPYAPANEGGSFQLINGNGFVSPSDLMNEPRAAYPDALTSNMPEEHQPAPNMDESGILFDDDDAPASIDEAEAYPRLPHETEEDALRRGMTAGQKKRKRQSMLIDPEMDPAHKEFVLTQQRQKLAAARKEGRHYITQGQLLGGEPFMVTLRVPNKKTELAAMAEIDAGRAAVRHNPREARTSITHARKDSNGFMDLDQMDVDDSELDGDIVISDVRARREGDPEPAHAPRPYQPGDSPLQTGKKRRGRPRMRLPSLEPGAIPYEATISARKKPGRPRKSRGGLVGGGEDDELEDPEFGDRYPSPKRKKSVAKPRESTGRPRGRSRKSTEAAKPAEHLEISDDEFDSDGDVIPKQRSNRRQSAPIEIAEDTPATESRPKKSRKSAAAVLESTEAPASSRSKRSRREVEFDHAMLPRNTKRSKRASTVMSQSIIGGANDGAGSADDGCGYGDNYQSQDDHTDDDEIFAARPARKMVGGVAGGRSLNISEADAEMAEAMFDEGEPMTIPMADDDDEYAGVEKAPEKKNNDYYSDSDDTLPAPSPSKQLASELDEQCVRHQSERLTALDHSLPPTREGSVESGYQVPSLTPQPRQPSPPGGFRMADMMPSSSPEYHRRVYQTPPAAPSDGYRMGSYSGIDTDAEEVPTAGASEDEDADLNAKIAAMRELEEEQEREKQAKIDAENERLAEISRKKKEVEDAKAEQRRLAKEEMDREIAEEKFRQKAEAEKVEMRRRAEENRLAMMQAEKEVEEELRKAAEEHRGRAASREAKSAAASAVPSAAASRVVSDEEGEDDEGDSEIQGAPASIWEPSSEEEVQEPMLSMAERRAAQGKTGTFKITARRSLVGVMVAKLTPKQKRAYSVSTAGGDGEETLAPRGSRARVGSSASATPSGTRRAIGPRR